jgi:DNA polymerase/3'-5' exonuclease PolX
LPIFSPLLDDIELLTPRVVSTVALYEDLLEKMPRKCVERIRDVVVPYARQLCPGIEVTAVGSYRRGKAQSGDVDLIFCHPGR